MKNVHGLDYHYFRKKLKSVLNDIAIYTPDELARELARLSITADSEVIKEKEFTQK